jgi:hypothetical protein
MSLAAVCATVVLTPTVTFQAPATRLERLIPDLAQSANLPWKVSPSLFNEVMVVKVTQVPVDELKSKIASTIRATWDKQSDGSWVLVRTQAQLIQMERDTVALKAQNIRQGLELSRPSLVKEFGDKEADLYLLRSQEEAKRRGDRMMIDRDPNGFTVGSPLKRAMLKLALDLDAITLATVPINGRKVFTLNPNRMQFPLGPQAKAILAKFSAEQNRWAQRISRHHQETESVQFAEDPLTHRSTVPSLPNVLLIASNSGEIGSVMLSIVVPHKQSALSTFHLMSRNARSSRFGPPEGAAGDPPIPLSADSEAFASMFRALMPGPDRGKELTPHQIKLLTEPETHDPLRFVLSDALFAWADQEKANLIAAPTDMSIILSILPAMTKKQTVKSLLEVLRSNGNMELNTKDGWCVATPMYPFDERQVTIQRNAYGRYLRALVKQKHNTIDLLSKFAVESGSTEEQNWARVFSLLIDPNSTDLMQPRWDVLKLHGTFTDGQKQTMMSGGEIKFGQLSDSQKKLLHRMAFSSISILNTMSHDPHDSPELLAYGLEPTVLLANGIPNDAVLTMRLSKSDAVIASDSKQPFSLGESFTADQLASRLSWEANSFDTYLPVVKRTFVMSFRVSKQLSGEMQYSDVVPQQKNSVGFNQLSAKFREEFKKAQEQLGRQEVTRPARNQNPPPPQS